MNILTIQHIVDTCKHSGYGIKITAEMHEPVLVDSELNERLDFGSYRLVEFDGEKWLMHFIEYGCLRFDKNGFGYLNSDWGRYVRENHAVTVRTKMRQALRVMIENPTDKSKTKFSGYAHEYQVICNIALKVRMHIVDEILDYRIEQHYVMTEDEAKMKESIKHAFRIGSVPSPEPLDRLYKQYWKEYIK